MLGPSQALATIAIIETSDIEQRMNPITNVAVCMVVALAFTWVATINVGYSSGCPCRHAHRASSRQEGGSRW